jgi:DNA helicase IV
VTGDGLTRHKPTRKDYSPPYGRVEVTETSFNGEGEFIGCGFRTYYVGDSRLHSYHFDRDTADDWGVWEWGHELYTLFTSPLRTYVAEGPRAKVRIEVSAIRHLTIDVDGTVKTVDEQVIRPKTTIPFSPLDDEIPIEDDNTRLLSDLASESKIDEEVETLVLGPTQLKERVQELKRGFLKSQLATLQAHQSEIVMRSHLESVIVQGTPGTGKTIIAAHRAAFLMLEPLIDRDPDYPGPIKGIQDGNILLLSPTAAYIQHVVPALEELLEDNPTPVQLILRTVPELEKHVFDQTLFNAVIEGTDPLLGQVRHVIVDEAQDVTPVQWSALRDLFPRATWTILGDQNQRTIRTLEFAQWDRLATFLGFETDAVVQLKLDFRGTNKILDFAHRVKGLGRAFESDVIQEGNRPKFVLTRTPSERTSTAFDIAHAFSRKTQSSVIVVDNHHRPALEAHFLTQNWEPRDGRWFPASGAFTPITISTPEELRSLEFDHVVLVEPAEYFTLTFGPKSESDDVLVDWQIKKNKLFIAITRANRTLTMVGLVPLPASLGDFYDSDVLSEN